MRYQALHSFGLAFSTPKGTGSSGKHTLSSSVQADSASMAARSKNKSPVRESISKTDKSQKSGTQGSPAQVGQPQWQDKKDDVIVEKSDQESPEKLNGSASLTGTPDLTAKGKLQLSFCFDPMSPSQRVLITEEDMKDPNAIFIALNRMFASMHENQIAMESQLCKNEEQVGRINESLNAMSGRISDLESASVSRRN